mmetsp:Transcript_74924/g.219502  ORF Transcript_74924/g.219502 Transcript_74924/m.219502 type:complete len:286 (+) Transcript_74924:84-941(+)
MARLTPPILVCALGLCCLGAQSLELTDQNWDYHVKGKMVMVKFISPTCAACEALKPEWEAAVKNPPAGVLVGEVDCKGSGMPLCVSHGIKSFPTIKFGDPTNLQFYRGKREFEEIKQQLAEVPKTCTPANLGACASEERSMIETLQAMPEEELEALVGACEYEKTFKGQWKRDNTVAFAAFKVDISPATKQECAKKCCEAAGCMAWVMTDGRCDFYGALDRRDMTFASEKSEYLQGKHVRSARKLDPTATLFTGNTKAHLGYGFARATHILRKEKPTAKSTKEEL